MFVDDAALPAHFVLTPDAAGDKYGSTAEALAFVHATAGSRMGLRMVLVHRERRGGRLYPYAADYPEGRVKPLVSERRWEELKGTNVVHALLPAIPRDARRAMRPPDGWVSLDVDIGNCWHAITAALTQDPVLHADLQDDVHQRVADALKLPRAQGKKLSNALLCGMRDYGVSQRLSIPQADAATLLSAYWGRWSVASSWIETLENWQRVAAQEEHTAVILRSPSGRASRWSPYELQERGGVWTAALRAVESDILDYALFLLHREVHHPDALRLCWPCYDGALFAAREHCVEWAQGAVRWAFETAVAAVRVSARIRIGVGETWGAAQSG